MKDIIFPEVDKIGLLNTAHIHCSIKTQKPYKLAGKFLTALPSVQFMEVWDAIMYLAHRADMPAKDRCALDGLLGELSFSLTKLRDSKEDRPEDLRQLDWLAVEQDSPEHTSEQ